MKTTNTGAMRRHHNECADHTTYARRLGDALELLCRARPSDDMLRAWIETDDDALAGFAKDYGPSWAQGIAVIDAAAVLAGQPIEGERHELAPRPIVPHEIAALAQSASEDWALMASERMTPGVVLGGPVQQFTNGSSQTQIAAFTVPSVPFDSSNEPADLQRANAEFAVACVAWVRSLIGGRLA